MSGSVHDQLGALLIEHYEEVHRHIRFRLDGARNLRRVMDSLDVVDSAFGKILRKVAEGDLDPEVALEHPTPLRWLLCIAVRHFRDKVRRLRREHPLSPEMLDYDLTSDMIDPPDAAASAEFLETLEQRFPRDVFEMVLFRRDGCSWKEISERTGIKLTTARSRTIRAVEQLVRDLRTDAGSRADT